jgi:hypothetical protein
MSNGFSSFDLLNDSILPTDHMTNPSIEPLTSDYWTTASSVSVPPDPMSNGFSSFDLLNDSILPTDHTTNPSIEPLTSDYWTTESLTSDYWPNPSIESLTYDHWFQSSFGVSEEFTDLPSGSVEVTEDFYQELEEALNVRVYFLIVAVTDSQRWINRELMHNFEGLAVGVLVLSD